MEPIRASLVAIALAGICGVACAGATTSSPPDGGGGGAGGVGSVGGAGGTSLGACPASATLITAAPACNTLANNAPAVPFTVGVGAAPVPAGGTIRDGLYEATRAEGYGAATPAGRRLTLAVLDGATRFLFAGEVLDAAGAQVISSFRVNATTSVAGTSVAFAMPTNCMSVASSPLPAALDFTAAGDTLVMSLAAAGATSVTTYTRRGCP